MTWKEPITDIFLVVEDLKSKWIKFQGTNLFNFIIVVIAILSEFETRKSIKILPQRMLLLCLSGAALKIRPEMPDNFAISLSLTEDNVSLYDYFTLFYFFK